MDILACVFPIQLGKPVENAKKIIEILDENGADVNLFPAYALTGISCGKLFSFKRFQDELEKAIDLLCAYTEKKKAVIVTSTQKHGNVAIFEGDVNTAGRFSYGGKTVCISKNAEERADIVLVPTAMPGYPCIKNDVCEFCAAASSKHGCVVAVANCGFGESSADNVFKGMAGVFNNGVITAFMAQDAPETIKAAANSEKKEGLIYKRPQRPVDKIPYYGKNDPKLYLNELFLLQVQSLYTRLHGSGLQKVAVNVSGGLDSTLALLVASETMQLLGLPPQNIIGLTLPGFGTTKRTNANAKKLMELLGVTNREIDIRESVRLHLEQIGHDGKTEDVTFENAQARERAQVLLDACNLEDALALGTGDLSEAALGFCTFAGDTLCHYNVNATVPKTLVRETVRFVAEKEGGALQDVLTDIADTPISPELKEGQKTEELLGPYLLHDFILYYFARHNLSVTDIRHYALATFDEYTDEEIDSALETFFKRFRQSQFKRSAACEGANLIGFTLPYFPADYSPDLL